MSEYIITDEQIAENRRLHGKKLLVMPVIVRCRDCKYADISYTHAAVTGELHCYGYLVEPWDWYNDEPSDGVEVNPDGYCAWGERKERIEQ